MLDETPYPLGEDDTTGAPNGDPDTALLREVEALLDRQVNPAVAAHGGHIAADRVEGGTVYLRMSGGCQGCAASSATLRQGVERMLRAALPQIGEIVDVTDHAAGSNPFYSLGDGNSPILNRPIPAGVIVLENGQVTVEPEYLAPRLGLHAGDAARGPAQRRRRRRHGNRPGCGWPARRGSSCAAVAAPGRPRSMLTARPARSPPPRVIEAAADKEQSLPQRVRAYLEALPPG